MLVDLFCHSGVSPRGTCVILSEPEFTELRNLQNVVRFICHSRGSYRKPALKYYPKRRVVFADLEGTKKNKPLAGYEY